MFQETLTKVRDEMLAEMKISGFWRHGVYLHTPTTYDINNGSCEDFAMKIEELVPDAVSYWIEDIDPKYPNHCIIEYKGRFYDAECIEGVDKIEELPICKKALSIKEEAV